MSDSDKERKPPSSTRFEAVIALFERCLDHPLSDRRDLLLAAAGHGKALAA